MGKMLRTMILAGALATVLAAAGCGAGPAPSPAPSPQEMPAKDFQLADMNGRTVALSDFRGRPVMLNFWASWCGPCREEMPYIQEIYDDEKWSGTGLMILAVNIGESPEQARGFLNDNGFSFPVLLDVKEEVARQYNIRGIPTTFFIDGDGIIKDSKVGSFSGKAEIEKRLGSVVP